jgi:hypothetical protein
MCADLLAVVGCPGLRHFIYKSRQHVQITSPEWEEPYLEDGPHRKRFVWASGHLLTTDLSRCINNYTILCTPGLAKLSH